MTTKKMNQEKILTFCMDANTNEPCAMPPAPPLPDDDLISDLLEDSRSAHAVLLARELNVIERQHRIAQLWLAAVVLCSSAGIFSHSHTDLWLALGFALGFGISVLLLNPQRSTAYGISLKPFNEPNVLGNREYARQLLLSTWQAILESSEKALDQRTMRLRVSVWLLALFTPVSILMRLP